MNTPQKRQSKPRQKTIDLGNLIKTYDTGLMAVANIAGVAPDRLKVSEVPSILKAAEADIAKAVGVSPDKIKIKLSLAA